MEDWAEIRRLHRSEEMPIKAIVRKLGVSRNAVRRALAADAPPKYSRPARGSAVDAVEPQVRALLAEWPTMPATVIAADRAVHRPDLHRDCRDPCLPLSAPGFPHSQQMSVA